MVRLDAQQSPAASQQKLRQAELKDALEQHAAFLACNLSHALGRHAIKSGLLAQLADVGGIDLLKSGSQGQLLCDPCFSCSLNHHVC